jgi:hypothetical protein
VLLPELNDWLLCAPRQKLHARGRYFPQIGDLQRGSKGEVSRSSALR